MEIDNLRRSGRTEPSSPNWSVETLNELTVKIGSGITPRGGSRVYKPYGRVFLRSQNVDWGKLLLDGVAFIDDKTHHTFDSTELHEGDVLLNITGASIGRAAVATSLVVGGNVNQHVCIIRVDPKRLDPGYLCHVLLSQNGQGQIESFQAGGNRQGLNFGQIGSISLPVPELTEQTAIATALTDADNLIQNLEQLIEKKKQIKQGAMQELLTGKRRLPGFNGEWQELNLGEVAQIKTGKKNNDDKLEDGNYPFFVRSQTIERIDSYSFDGEAILIPGEGGIGTIIHYVDGRFDYHQRVYKISNFAEGISGKYVYYCLSHFFYDHAMKNTVKATVDSLRLPTFQTFTFQCPSISEQRDIVEVLSDLDMDISSLENKKIKHVSLKQAMMQVLLTGQIRLS